MLNEKMQEALNDQFNFEMYSANIYLSMAAWFDHNNLPGMAQWMKTQYQEEMFHAMKFYSFINDRGGKVKIQALQEPQSEWENPKAVFENSLKHEMVVTSRINNLMTLAHEEKDHASINFLHWFVGEQVEEEANVDGIIKQLTLMENAPGALFMLDRELGQRTFTPPADAEA